ncbi:transcription factor bHLH146-like [Cicer arietinum]|uniref:Transcription factor bHLH146-like n=1 Tax=Cicer arietinum TaxID=3827 RepID=A0A1S2YPE6_CICAR|nr:transcription factor bHLH146-like [Cicer arietinum]
MEAQSNKRRRVYSLEPNKIVQTIFARKYLSYLVPALMKIKEKSSTKDKNNHIDDIKNAVKYEVDMAMVLSAQGFAWSNGLKVKLQKNDENEKREGSSSRIYDQNDLAKEDNEEDEKMKRLKRLIPGGEEMCDEQVVNELESYINCLQMQVNVLQCLLAETC